MILMSFSLKPENFRVLLIPVVSAACPGPLDEDSVLPPLPGDTMPLMQACLQQQLVQSMGLDLSRLSCCTLKGCLLPPLCNHCPQMLPLGPVSPREPVMPCLIDHIR